MSALSQQTGYWRQIEVWLLFLALTLAIFACYGLSAAGILMQNSLLKTSAELMGADRILSATRPAQPQWLERANKQQLLSSEQWGFNSMIFAGGELDAPMQLVSAKAVDSAYPVKGKLAVETLTGTAHTRPKRGEVYLDRRLQELLKLELGDSVELGLASFKVSGWLAQQPDTGFNIWGNLPSLMLQLEDVAQTQVVQPGSRIWYRYLLSGEQAELKRYDHWLKPKLSPIYRYQGIDQQEGRLATTLKRNEVVLKLAGLLTVLLSLAAIAVIAQHFAQVQQKEVALLKALGMSRWSIGLRYGWLMSQMILASSLVGIGLAQLSLQCVATALAAQMPFLQITWVVEALLLTLMSCVGGVLLFLGRPFIALLNTSASRLLQGQSASLKQNSMGWVLALAALFLCLLLLFAGSYQLATILFVIALGAISLVYFFSRWLLKGLNWLLSQKSLAVRLACQNLIRRHEQNRLLLSGFTLAGVLALSIFYLRHDLIQQWREQLPEQSANYFALNIQPSQKSEFLQWLHHQQLPVSYLYPVIRGRLAAVNQQPIVERVEALNNGSRRYITRELNLTFREELPEGNQLRQGEFLNGPQAVSIESDMAARLGLKLGDQITLDIAGQPITAELSSIREVNWNSMKPNFFMILAPELLESFSATYLASFYVPPESTGLASELTQRFPTITLINIESIIVRLESVITHSSYALTLILVLVLVATGLLLLAQIRAGLASRQQELITMQTLGAQRGLLTQLTLTEFTLLGVLAGVISVVLTELLLALLFVLTLALSAQWHPLLWLLGPLLGAAVIGSLGWFGCQHLLREGALLRLKQSSAG